MASVLRQAVVLSIALAALQHVENECVFARMVIQDPEQTGAVNADGATATTPVKKNSAASRRGRGPARCKLRHAGDHVVRSSNQAYTV